MTSRERAVQLEEAVCELLNGKLVPGSGSKGQKGDVKSTTFLAEAKQRSQTDSSGGIITLELPWLETIWEHARNEQRHPLLAVETGAMDRAVLIPDWVYGELGGEPPSRTHRCENRSLRVGALLLCRLPTLVIFTRLEVAEPHWVILSWGAMLELRQAYEKPAEPRLNPISDSGITSRAKRWTKPAPWRQRPFR